MKILVALAAPAILYWQDLVLIANEALNSDLSTHIIAVPFLLGYVLYRRRSIFATSTSNNSSRARKNLPIVEIAGTLLCLLAYLIKWFGSYTFQPLEYHVASLPLFAAGIILIIFNAQTLRTLLFPVAFLTFLIPPPLEIAQAAGAALAAFSAQASYTVVKSMGLPVSLLNQYGSPLIYLTTTSGDTVPFAVDIACSGLYSLIGFILFAVFTAYISRGSMAKKLAVFSLGTPLIYALNIFRITLLILIGYHYGPELALSTFHLMGGWTLILLGTLILLIVAEKVFKIQVFGKTSETCSHSMEDGGGSFCLLCGKMLKPPSINMTKTDVFKLIVILVVAVSLLYIQVPVFALTRGAAEVLIKKPTGQEATTKILPELEGHTLRFVYRDVDFENISGQDASLMYQYLPENRSATIIWVGLEIGPTKGCLHPWEVCLITWPQTHGGEVDVTQLDLRDIHLLENPPLSARYFAFQSKDTDNTQIILYWYTRSIFKTEEGYQQKWSKISVIEYTQNPKEYKAVEDELLPVAKAIVNHWQPVETWSMAALTIAENGPALITITVATIAGAVIFSYLLELNRKKSAKRVYGQLSDREDRQILDAVRALKKELANETNILSKYNEISGEDIDIETLHRKLVEAAEAGLLKRSIINIDDTPYISWKPNY